MNKKIIKRKWELKKKIVYDYRNKLKEEEVTFENRKI